MSARSLAVAAAIVACASAQSARADVRDDYWLHCAGCHGPSGAGVPGVVPSLRELGTLVALPGGRELLVRVPGVAQSSLDDARLAALLDWVLAHFAETKLEPGYAAEEVRRLRADPVRDPAAARAALVVE